MRLTGAGVRAVGVTLLLAGLIAGAPATGAGAAAVGLFPTDTLTVRDATQATGRRVALPRPDCTARPTACEVTRLLNQLDGFDLDPRLSLRFDRRVDPHVVAATTTITGGGRRIGVDRVVYDGVTHTVYAHPARQLASGTRYRLRSGARTSTFTTMSATHGLAALRRQLDSGAAYALAGIPATARGLRVEHVAPAAGTTVTYTSDLGTDVATATVPGIPVGGAGEYVFGSYLAPTWLTADRYIPQTPTRGPGPAPRGQARVPFVLVLPAGTAPPGGWPVAVFGHGFTGVVSDVFRASATDAGRGIATLATGVVGHGGGPRSTWAVTTNGVTTVLPAYGRGVDLDRNGTIGPYEGLGTPAGPYAAVNFRDGLRQTAADVMTLIRAVGRGVDVDRDGATDLRRTGVTYFGQSFGGIYGTMLGGTDPQVRTLALNVAGGPIAEIARLSPSLRPILSQSLAAAVPPLLNGGTAGFTESMPLRGDPPVLDPVRGALAIQAFLADTTWVDRPGSPEAFAPQLRGKHVLFQNVVGDRTVPNPTSYTLLAAGGLFGRESLYRNDLTPQRDLNPHAFLFDSRFTAGALPGQRQITEFLATGRVRDPDGPGPLWEVPIHDPAILLELHF
jgi:hypothetical protein